MFTSVMPCWSKGNRPAPLSCSPTRRNFPPPSWIIAHLSQCCISSDFCHFLNISSSPQMNAFFSSYTIPCEGFSPCIVPVLFLESFHWQSWISRCCITSWCEEDKDFQVLFESFLLLLPALYVLNMWMIFCTLSQNLLLPPLINISIHELLSIFTLNSRGYKDTIM